MARSVERQAALFDDPNELPANVILATLHYLGPTEREMLLSVEDEALMRRIPWASYREPKWHGARATGGGGDYKRWLAQKA